MTKPGKRVATRNSDSDTGTVSTAPLHPVDRDLFEERLEKVLAEAPSPEAGLFGPDSVVWEVTRHLPVYALSTPLGGFMDTAHPWVAHGVADHSRIFTDPRKRARMTYLMLMRIVFGDVDTVRRTSRGLNAMHHRVQGTLPERAGRFEAGSTYTANEAEALLFVHLVFFWTRLTMYQRIVRPLTPAELDTYVAESARFAACFGIPAEMLPASYAEFEQRVQGFAASDTVATTEASRRTVDFLLHQVPAPGRPVLAAFLVEVMPEPLSRALELPARGTRTRLLAGLLFLGLKVGRRVTPEGARYVPAYLEARERTGGRAQPRLSRRISTALVGREASA